MSSTSPAKHYSLMLMTIRALPFDVFELIDEPQSELHAALMRPHLQTMVVDDAHHCAYLLRDLAMKSAKLYQ